MAKDPEYRAHQEWLGYVQPVGLVVSIPALLSAQAYINRNIAPDQPKLLASLAKDKRGEPLPQIADFADFTRAVLGWEPSDLVPAPDSLNVVLEAYDEVLRSTFAVKDPQGKDEQRPWLMLVQCYPTGTDLDANAAAESHHWQASPQARLEHLLLKTEVPIGLLFNHTHLRLVYRPAGENSGHLTFPVAAMTEVAGRPIFAAMHELLRAERVFGFGIDPKNRLANILAESRKYQNVVSTQLSEQVLAALYELVRGFQAANAQAHGEILAAALRDDPNHVYAGLLTVLLRLVFVLFAEDRDLLSTDPLYSRFYSLTGLFTRLREDFGRHSDTMEQRYGAWAQLLVLFRMIFDGARHGKFHLPPREGYLFDPDRYPFLEGRAKSARRQQGEKLAVPRVSDGVVYRVLQNLLILDGERLSYRTLDVEHIGGVYETMMGFDLEVAKGRSIAIKPTKSHGAPATINLDELLATKADGRGKWLKEQSDQALAGQAGDSLKSAATLEDLLAALEKKIAREATPHVVPPGAIILQPSDERRRSGSHYTPRSLTEPIVRTTLRPVLEQLRSSPPLPLGEGRGEGITPEQILDLNVCDPAMGSGAFLVEACRQLADKLVEAWHTHKCVPAIPLDEDELKHAMRIVAQRCLYGVDKNPLAVDLAKLSLWLATLAKDHPFTFLDHNLKAGDSLVGLTQRQIEEFTWEPRGAGVSPAKSSPRRRNAAMQAPVFFGDPIKDKLRHVLAMRQQILAAAEHEPYALLRQKLATVDENLTLARLTGDLAIAAYFGSEKDKGRRELLATYGRKLTLFFGPPPQQLVYTELSAIAKSLRSGERPIEPFHWEIEFPEVFGRETAGFDGIVGNPPFAGKNTLINGNREGFLDWLQTLHEESHGNADLVAHFFRRAFNLLRPKGCFGLIATNTIGQGDTRSTGLRWICTSGGTIYAARKRYKWPGQAAVVVSVVNVCRGATPGPFVLDGREVPIITAYLFHAGGHENPVTLQANEAKSFQGSIVLGMGFTFDDTDRSGIANPVSLMHELIAKDSRNAECITPYIGGEEVNDSPTHAHHRYVINFGEASEEAARRWPSLISIVEEKVKPERLRQNDRGAKEKWWQFIRPRPELTAAIRHLKQVLVLPRTSKYLGYVFLPRTTVFSENLVVFAMGNFGAYGIQQSRLHEVWVRFTSSTLEDRQGYRPSDCFETFPFPTGVLVPASGDEDPDLAALETAGREYYEFRAALMVQNDEGLTTTYNRFHDRDHDATEVNKEIVAGILKLRELHAAMDRAVLEAYGWHDLAERATCEFLLDYEEDDDEEESAGKKSKKKKPWRYRWPDPFRDDVLARLLELNRQRAEQERPAGAAASAAEEASAKPKSKRPTKSRKINPAQKELLGDDS